MSVDACFAAFRVGRFPPRAEHLEWEALRAAEKAAQRQVAKERDDEEQRRWELQDAAALQAAMKTRRETLENEVGGGHARVPLPRVSRNTPVQCARV